MPQFIFKNGLSLLFKNLLLVVFSITLGAIVLGQSNPNVDDARPLTTEQPIERELKSDEAHSYNLRLDAGQYLNIVVEQKGIDVVVSFFDPGGKKIAEVDSPNGANGAEPLFLITETAGDYRLEVRSLEKSAPVGKYEAKIKEQRIATEKDRSKVSAEKLSAEGESLRLQGSAEALRGAIKKYEEAARLYRNIGDASGETAMLNVSGFLYSELGDDKKALEYYMQALPIARASGDKAGEGNTLNIIGNVYDNIGNKPKALEYYTQSLPLRRAGGDKSGEAITLSNLGKIYYDSGENQKALEFYEQSLPLARSVNDGRTEAGALNSIGAIYSTLGENQKALKYYTQALPVRRRSGDQRGEASTLNNIAFVYYDLGDKPKAIEYWTQILPIFRLTGDKKSEASTLNNIGKIYSDLGDKQKALEIYAQALSLRRELGDKSGTAITLNNIGLVYYDAGDKQKALEYFTQSLSLRREVGDKGGEARTLSNLGKTYDALGDRQKGLEHFSQALPLFRAVGDKTGEAAALDYLAIAFASGNKRFGVFFGKQSVKNYQILRTNIKELDKNLQQVFLKSIEGSYRRLANALIAQKRLPEAQQVLNLFKDQQYFDFNSNKQVAALNLTEREAKIEQEFNQKLEAVVAAIRAIDNFKRDIGTRSMSADDKAQMKSLTDKENVAKNEYLAFFNQSEKDFAALLDEKDKEPSVDDLIQMQTALRETSAATKQNTVAVYQLVGEENYSALIITSDQIKSVSTPIKNTVLNEKAKQLWALLQSDKYDVSKLSKEIYDTAFKPIEKELPKDTKTILWSLDGNLRYVPMAALFDGKRYLVERFNHVNFTRADKNRMTSLVSPVWTGAGFGTSEAKTVEILGNKISFNSLPGVSEELSAIFKQTDSRTGVIKGNAFKDDQFTKTNFLNGLKQQNPLIHIASHFSFRPGDEARSFLLLGDGTVMTLEEMKRQKDLFQGVELLTLSACNTAAQQPDANGREVDAFFELAQRLGASSVLATLWSVADNSTPWLMRDFYSIRESKKGLTKTEALRHAQLALLKGTAKTKPLPTGEKGVSNKLQIVVTPDGKRSGDDNTRAEIVYIAENDAPLYKKNDKAQFAHPYYWSPFVLIGNWK